VLVNNSFSPMTGPGVTTYTQSSNPTYRGMEWYDDGTADGQVYALNTGALGYMLLNTLSFPSASGYAGAFFPTANNLPSGYTTSGDLTVSGDTLYVMVASSTDSKLYSYDLSAGPNGQFTFLADYAGKRFSSLAAVPAVPEPAEWAMLLAGLVVVGFIARRRNPLVS
jgi:hypothetical protein